MSDIWMEKETKHFLVGEAAKFQENVYSYSETFIIWQSLGQENCVG